MTQELFRESGGKIPEDSDLKSSFNWDSNYREHMCRNNTKYRSSYFRRTSRFLSFFLYSLLESRDIELKNISSDFDVLKASIPM